MWILKIRTIVRSGSTTIILGKAEVQKILQLDHSLVLAHQTSGLMCGLK
jgi:hypothetical protein